MKRFFKNNPTTSNQSSNKRPVILDNILIRWNALSSTRFRTCSNIVRQTLSALGITRSTINFPISNNHSFIHRLSTSVKTKSGRLNHLKQYFFLSLFAIIFAANLGHAFPQKLGDLDEDNKPTVRDLIKLINHVNGTTPLPENMRGFADINKDGKADQSDETAIIDAILGSTELPKAEAGLVTEFSPNNGERMVALNRKAIIRFDQEINPATVTADSFYLIANGQKIPGGIRVSSTNRFATFIPDQSWQSSTEVRLVVEGNLILGSLGIPLDANSNGLPGGRATMDFRTVPNTQISGTVVFGFVYASEPGPSGEDLPLEGVTIRVDGMEELNAVTDSTGKFTLVDVPAPEFYVHVDGSTVSHVSGQIISNNGYYPNVGKPFHSVPGQTTQIELNGEPFNIYLPFILNEAIHDITPGESMTIKLPDTQIADDTDLALVSLTIPANSLVDDDGSPGTTVGIFRVDSDRLPAPLPDGLEHSFDITIQADVSNFDVPAPITFPNVDKLAPGEKTILFSFDHQKGEWVAVGTMTVSEDGLTVVSDNGVGVRAPGWHGQQPGTILIPPPPLPPSLCPIPMILNPELLNCYDKVMDDYTENVTLCFIAIIFPNAMITIPSCILGVTGKMLFDRQDCSDSHTRCTIPRNPRLFNIAPINQNVSVDDATREKIDQINVLLNDISNLTYPFSIKNEVISKDAELQIKNLTQQAEMIANGNLDSFIESVNIEHESVLDEIEVNAPDYPILFLANIVDNDNVFQIRGKTEPFGQYQLFIQRDSNVYITFYDPIKNQIGFASSFLRQNTEYDFPRFILRPVGKLLDFDNDNLVDIAELVIGTDANNPDTDNDGIKDGAEVEQGLDPLDDRGFPTGIISSLPLMGEAKEVVIQGSILQAEGQTAYIATGSHGLAIVDSTQFNNPIVLGQLDLPGINVDVAVESRLQMAVLAGSTGGLHFVDVSDPMLPTLIKTISINANLVVVLEGVAYVAVGSQLRSYDMATGDRLQTLILDGVDLTGLACEGLTLYSMDTNRILRAIDISGLEMIELGSVQMPDGGGRLFVGNGIAYAAATNNNRGGFATADVSIPDNIVILSGSDVPSGFVAPRTHIVANGSGIGILVGRPTFGNINAFDLMDLSDQENTDSLLTRIILPARPNSVTIGGGIAFVANGTSGLQIVNYLSFDSQGQAPDIVEIDTAFIDKDLDTEGVQAEEGKRISIGAMLHDDVQVRNVEFFVDGELVASDVTFPFEHRMVVPLIEQQNTLTLLINAIDTGGNETFSSEVIVEIIKDATPPRIKRKSPLPNSVLGNVDEVSVAFSELMDLTTLSSSSIFIEEAGTDKRFGTDDDQTLSATINWREEIFTATLDFSNVLTAGFYRVNATDSLTDLAGNPIEASEQWTFRIFDISDDRDNDGVPDDVETLLGLNPDDPDTDGNGIVDGLEDFDNDGLVNLLEILTENDPTIGDSNNNGIIDGEEDTDRDGLKDVDEFLIHNTDFLNHDTDRDGFNDGDEFNHKSDPLDPNSLPPNLASGIMLSVNNISLVQEGIFIGSPISVRNDSIQGESEFSAAVSVFNKNLVISDGQAFSGTVSVRNEAIQGDNEFSGFVSVFNNRLEIDEIAGTLTVFNRGLVIGDGIAIGGSLSVWNNTLQGDSEFSGSFSILNKNMVVDDISETLTVFNISLVFGDGFVFGGPLSVQNHATQGDDEISTSLSVFNQELVVVDGQALGETLSVENQVIPYLNEGVVQGGVLSVENLNE